MMEESDPHSQMKLDKIAAARKKLKQYQSKTPKSDKNKDDLGEEKITTGQQPSSVAASEYSSHNITRDVVAENVPPFMFNSNDNHQSLTNTDETEPQLQSIVDSFSGNQNIDLFGQFNTINFGEIPKQQPTNSNITGMSLQSYFTQDSTFATDFFGNNQQKSESVVDDTTSGQLDGGGGDDDHLTPQQQFSYNILSLPENNSETISTISERTENDSSHGGGGGGQGGYFSEAGILSVHTTNDLNDDNETEKKMSGTPTETLNQLSAQMSSILMADESQLLVDDNISNCNSPSVLNLEQKNQELQIMLQSEKIRNEELNFRVRDQNACIEELKIELQKMQYDRTVNVTGGVDIRNLQEQLENHIKTVGILVGEKSELQAALNKSQAHNRETTTEVDELQSRLSASRHKVQEVEKELNQSRTSCERLSAGQQKLVTEVETLQDQLKKLTVDHRDTVEELEILNEKLRLKSIEMETLREDVSKKNSEINLYKLKIEQLVSGGDLNATDAPNFTELTRQNENFVKQVADYQTLVEQMKVEKDQSDLYYQNYLTQLNGEMTGLSTRLQEMNADKEKLIQREQNLVKHVGELEKNLQQQMTANRNLVEQQTLLQSSQNIHGNSNVGNLVDTKLENELKRVHERVAELEKEAQDNLKRLEDSKLTFNQLQHNLTEKTEHIAQLEMTIERLQSNRPDPTNLMASIESDRLAASRAVSQNVELKNQLEEIQRAFVQISNDKLELTDRLQTEQHLCREMKTRFDEMETELSALREKFDNKDAEMIRLAGENSELNKQILQQSQELDRLRHYESRNHFGPVLQTELQNANDQIAYLRSRIKEMEKSKTESTTTATTNVIVDESDRTTNSTLEGKELVEASTEVTEETQIADEENLMSTSNFMMASHDAMEKLQERFRRTMDEIADLTEEKQKLEHLVMQLQGETETIGEYVALYQQQRRLLKQRELEKDFELTKLAEDRELLKEKLTYFNSLIEQFLVEKGVQPPPKFLSNGHHHHSHNDSDSGQLTPSHSHAHTSTSPSMDTHSIKLDKTVQNVTNNGVDSTNETAFKILNLLEEIKVVNNSMDNLQHCACCSGQLETV